jgi:hypothetical protein
VRAHTAATLTNDNHRGVTMSRLINLLALSLFACGAAYAADKPMTPQQEKMAECSKANKGKTGDDYKKAQSDCLKADSKPAAKPMTQQEKMAACSKANKGKTGDDYKKAQSECLKK